MKSKTLTRLALICGGMLAFAAQMPAAQTGSVVSWGSMVLPRVEPGTRFTAIAAGGRHTLAIESDGKVVAWGWNVDGQSTVPTGLSEVVASAAGEAHSMALRSDGTVVAWGSNRAGESAVPANLNGVVAIAAGGCHSLALKSDGTVVAWGSNQDGQSTVPGNLSGVVTIAAGCGHSLALKTDGTLVGWGRNDYGQSSVPPNLSGVVAIAAGREHSLAVKSDGTVVAWGANVFGQSTVSGSLLSGVVAIGAGGYHNLALKSDGTVVAWGDNYWGQCTVPANLRGVAAIAAGGWHSLALKSDGTVVAWGANSYGQSTVPANLSGVVAIAAGSMHSLALKSDSTLVAWGDDSSGLSTVPANLSGVAAIAAGWFHSLALKSDGTVVAWGDSFGESTVPGNLSGVVTIAAGCGHSLALKTDGTLVGWGRNDYGQSTLPANPSGVLAIAAGYGHSLALKTDGAVIGWGRNDCRQNAVPANLSGAIAIADGGGPESSHSLALVRDEGQVYPPSIVSGPANGSPQAGASVNLTVLATGTSPLQYQWRKNGLDIPGAISAALTLNSAGASDSGGYSVVVRNPYGLVETAMSFVAVLADGANGHSPMQVSVGSVPTPTEGVDSLVLITHGWQPPWSPLPLAMPDWVSDLELAIKAKAPNWLVTHIDWLERAYAMDADVARERGKLFGSDYGRALRQSQWKRVHLIAKSAGSAVIEEIARALRDKPNPPVIQETFLDPYTGKGLEGRREYGENANWAENYFAVDLSTDVGGSVYGLFLTEHQSLSSTSGPLDWAHNVDIGGTLGLAAQLLPVVSPSGVAGSTPVLAGSAPSHDSPVDFYLSTIGGTEPSCATGYGFPLSLEQNGSAKWASYERGNKPAVPLCADLSVSQREKPVRSDGALDLSWIPSGTSPAGVEQFGARGAGLTVTPEGPHLLGGGDPPTSQPAWLALGVTTTNLVNFVQFEAAFMGTNGSEGLLTVYWNTNQIGMLDERFGTTNLGTHRFALPGTVRPGLYTLSFRLDAFNQTASSIMVTNVGTGYVGVTDPISLDIALGTNGAPVVQLTAAPGYHYLLQSSTNLTDWAPAALLVNTSGTVRFAEPAVTNSSQRFYRAVMP